MVAIEAGDQLGLEVIPRTELEEVRGEAGWMVYAGRLVAYYGGFTLIRDATGDLEWVYSKMLATPSGTPVSSSTANSTPMYFKK
jgi:hypothetical protein